MNVHEVNTAVIGMMGFTSSLRPFACFHVLSRLFQMSFAVSTTSQQQKKSLQNFYKEWPTGPFDGQRGNCQLAKDAFGLSQESASS